MVEEDKIHSLVKNVNKYININYDLIKLESIENISLIGSKLFANLFLLILSFFLSFL